MIKLASRLFMALLTFGLCACAKPDLKTVDHNADALWKNYAQSAKTVSKPFRTQLSLRYGVEGRTDRVSALLWGNSAQGLRLDISASVGITVAKILEKPQDFLLYIPQENVAYTHEGKEKASFTAGIPMPLNLEHLTLLLQGHHASVFGLRYQGQPLAVDKATALLINPDDLPNSAKAYTLEEGPFRGMLVLNSLGQPVFWQEDNSTGWTMEISYKEHELLPYKLYIKHIASERKAVLIVKERAFDLDLFTPEQMRLILPKETVIHPLEDLNANNY